MSLHLTISHELEKLLRKAWGEDLDRAALEALAIEGYRQRRLSAHEVGQLLGLPDRWAVEGWLASRNVLLNYDANDVDDDRRTLNALLGPRH